MEDYDLNTFEEEYYHSEFQLMSEYCLLPTVTQILKFIAELLCFNLIFLFLSRNFAKGSEFLYHISSTLIGLIYLLSSFKISVEILYVILMVYIVYIVIVTCQRFNRFCFKLSIWVMFISMLVGCEFFYHDHDAWLKVRSVVMIAMMKVMSLAFDLKTGMQLPSVIAYSGYIWCPANSALGPWITYKEYLAAHQHPKKINNRWILSVLYLLIAAVVLVCCSNCVNVYILSDDYFPDYVTLFREALSFRMSHYFISYVASAAMITAGFTNDPNKWSYTITNPAKVELPRSLVDVVINWNIPIHRFLKKYVFQDLLPHGALLAVFMTYIISSMLHGLNIEISCVLLSLGLFSYVQTWFQDEMANSIDSCCRVRPCQKCNHFYKPNSFLTTVANKLFSVATIVQLAYVGCIMENVGTSTSILQSVLNIWHKWHSLHAIGHIISLVQVCYCIVCIID